ncbi:MAG: 4-(cytidine 5'-diphospho)-2-C-methyl-D-erythritol kinase [Burkholderiales bacterium]|nr:4-(cytidine 5'-diphospho)-2-C-methyl-D-erythritol kinase [Burkholderiales bacterium]
MTALYNVPAPAKINWFLHVLGRRADGYHELQTVFQFIDWCDWLDFERNETGAIWREGGNDLPGDDLCVRAAQLLQRHTGCHFGVRIHLCKSIPLQAGLGGGSSDAASTLLALNRLWGLGLARPALQRLGLQLGADVPVFIFGHNAFAQGVGEKLTAVDLPTWPMLVAWPGQGVSTATIFTSEALTRSTPAVTISSFAEFVQLAQVEDVEACGAKARGADVLKTNAPKAVWAASHEAAQATTACATVMRQIPKLGLDFGRNDLQAAAQAALPQLAQAETWLLGQTGSGLVRMSGSGSALFSPCRPSLEGSLQPVPDGWRVRQCRALARHPLAGWAAED